MVEQGAVPPGAVREALQGQKEIRASGISSSNIRVEVAQLDRLMNLVGKLVLARNQILQFSSTQRDAAFLALQAHQLKQAGHFRRRSWPPAPRGGFKAG